MTLATVPPGLTTLTCLDKSIRVPLAKMLSAGFLCAALSPVLIFLTWRKGIDVIARLSPILPRRTLCLILLNFNDQEVVYPTYCFLEFILNTNGLIQLF